MMYLVENKETKEIYLVERPNVDERLVSWQECQQQKTYVRWCHTNELVPKSATSLEKYLSSINEERQKGGDL
jgi:hypothetical protein